MNLLKLAFGLIREAAGTDIGRDVIHNMRPSSRKEPEPPPAVDVGGLLAEHRAQVNQSLQAMAEAVNEQNVRLEEAIRWQRIWNRVLALGLIGALIAAMVAMWIR